MTGEPNIVSSCCCQQCQRRTGSLVAVQAIYGIEQVQAITGGSLTFERTGETGKQITFHFCPSCGTTLYWIPEFRPGKIAVAAGAFADATFPAPARLVWTDYRHPWVMVPEGTIEFPGNA
jgi:hypothetical protein